MLEMHQFLKKSSEGIKNMKGHEVVFQIAAQTFLKSEVGFHTLLHITCESVSQKKWSKAGWSIIF